jgi:3-isopropylmalate/(R)-2-methylmalate dehydratase small subunit
MPSHAHRLKVQNDITTDMIFPCKYSLDSMDAKEVSKHLFETVDPAFSKLIRSGDLLVAGENLGSGPMSVQAAMALKISGVGAVLAKNCTRIFYRNAINAGLCVIECDTKFIDDMDELILELDKSVIRNVTKGINIEIRPVPKVIVEFLKKGGVLHCFKEAQGFGGIA